LAPAAWAMLVTWVANSFGVDLNERIGDLVGVSAMDVSKVAPFVLFAVLYLVGRYRPELERVLLGVRVEDTIYTQPADV
jgi:hypothetical protein